MKKIFMAILCLVMLSPLCFANSNSKVVNSVKKVPQAITSDTTSATKSSANTTKCNCNKAANTQLKCNCNCCKNEKCNCKEKCNCSDKKIDKCIKNEKLKVYADLELSTEQIKLAKNIDKKYSAQKKAAVKNLYKSSKKLKMLKTQKASNLRIKLQERKVKAAYKKAQKCFQKSQVEFEAIL